MSIQKPYDINIRGSTIDGNEEFELRWKVSGDTSSGYQILIINNSTDNISYDSGKVVSYSTRYTIESGQIANGEEYKLIIKLFDNNENEVESDQVIFQTSSRPVVEVDSIGIIGSQSYNFSATYNQAEGIGVRSYVVYLYNSNEQIISQSNIKRIYPVEHMFHGLQSENTYYVEFQVTSETGLIGTSGLMQFNVLYTQPRVNVRINAENIEGAGIGLNWSVIQIIGEMVNPEENMEDYFISDEYDVNNQLIDLRNSDGVLFDENFSADRNFTLKIWLKNPEKSFTTSHEDNMDLINIRGVNGNLKIQYWEDKKFHVFKKEGNHYSHYVSNVVEGEDFYLGLQQINNDITVISEVAE